MADFGAELHDRIKADFERRCASDSYINAIRRKIKNGKADMNDTSVYARQLGVRLRQAIESNVREGDFTDGRIYFDTARSILEPLLRDNYEDINAVCEEVQRELDKKQGIGLQPQHADFPDERTRAACGGVAAAESSEKAAEVMGVTAESITKSMQVDFVQKNLDFRSQAGLDTYIERTDSSGCCAWCAALAGRYRYPDDTPRDIFRRHDNCTCDVSYVSSKGRQNVHSKKWQTPAADMAKRIEYETSVPKPMKLTAKEAKAKEAKILAQRALTYREQRGIIEQRYTTAGLMFLSHRDDLYKFAIKVPPIEKFEDVTMHADRESFLILNPSTGDIEQRVTAKKLAELLRSSSNYNNSDIRLLSCQAGYGGENSIAQQLADELGVIVKAPTETLAIDNTGKTFISDNEILLDLWENGEDVQETGKWEDFAPRRRDR